MAKYHWTLWRNALRQHLLHPNQRTLRRPTGQWTTISDWKWTYSPSENRIYQTTGLNYTFWTAIPTRTQRQRFQIGDTSPHRPHDILPATVFLRTPHLLTLTGIGQLQLSAPTNLTDLRSHILALPQSDQWASTRTEITDNGLDLALGITQGNATAISDGSYKEQYGASCSILRGPNRTKRIITINAVPGPPDAQSAYRSKLAGISGSLLILPALCNLHQITDGLITIGLDGKSAIDTVSSTKPLRPQQPDFDLLCDIRAKLL